MTQLKLGILPLEIDTGRFTPFYDRGKKIEPSEKLCKFCDIKTREDEILSFSVQNMMKFAHMYLKYAKKKSTYICNAKSSKRLNITSQRWMV